MEKKFLFLAKIIRIFEVGWEKYFSECYFRIVSRLGIFTWRGIVSFVIFFSDVETINNAFTWRRIFLHVSFFSRDIETINNSF